MPIAMVVGVLGHDHLGRLDFLTSWMVALMLFITFTKVRAADIRIERIHLGQLALQLLGGVLLYVALRLFGVQEVICQGVLMCVFAPAATASPVVGAMLGANVTTMATFTLISNLSVAIVAPLLFSFIGVHQELSFLAAFWLVFRRLLLVVVLPFVASQLLRKVSRRAHDFVLSHQSWSFYLWVASLTILMSSTTNFILAQPRESLATELILAVAAGVLCLAQFAIGRKWGERCGDKAAGGQSAGQKNTLLAILLAQSYLMPLSSVAPAAYVVWQNLMNSYQLSKKR